MGKFVLGLLIGYLIIKGIDSIGVPIDTVINTINSYINTAIDFVIGL